MSGSRLGRVLTAALAAVMIGLVVGLPVVASPIPLMTDAPFHLAGGSVVAHFSDPAWHFSEQFEWQWMPYVTVYALIALLEQVLAPLVAFQVAIAVVLTSLPLGLAALCRSVGKSPWLGLVGLWLVWTRQTTWGFLNFVLAIGLFGLVLAVTINQCRAPNRRRSVALAGLLVLLLATHPFRFPYAVAGVAIAVGCSHLLGQKRAASHWLTHFGLPTLGPVALFAAWWVSRPTDLRGDIDWTPRPERLLEIDHHLFDVFNDQAHRLAIDRGLIVLAVLMAALAAYHGLAGYRDRNVKRNERWRHDRAGRLAILICGVMVAGLYVALPMQIGRWWYVFPREALTVCFILIPLLPDFASAATHEDRHPQATAPSQRLTFASLLILTCSLGPSTRVTANHFRRFGESTAGFRRLVAKLPRAPKLLYLVFDHRGTDLRSPAYIHLPAYVQALKGGWLSFHFATLGSQPFAYRSDANADAPPAVPNRWEWTPAKYQHAKRGEYFDWYLIRSPIDPSAWLQGSPEVTPIAHEDKWYLYRRADGR